MNAQRWLWTLLVVLGAAAAVSAPVYGVFGEQGRIGPGFMPLAAGLVLAVLSAAQLLGRPVAEAAPQAEDVDEAGRTPARRAWILRRVLVLLVAALALVPVIGLVPALTGLVWVISAWLEGRNPWSSLVFAVAAGAAVWVIFRVLLAVPLPTGLFG
ncbi:tripartite tricarboxylate transporter TctB family protein [Saccharopolyspora flava]|uniref:Tripartite tricarboxylate transporter TctB family protein n=1 Tax=Saccharopolyspora flava TaxID=95161 RepID=A0A1I6SUP2_9PSEU|nr:tripartite tricarboxylate transporter TctB family protein [Saccharopolyspora flava]SFS80649.1 Tripartite tricarboxylate transporter TctB family protein [Saccharopolyspora flava]